MLQGKETSDFGIIATQSSYFWLPNMIGSYKTSASHWLEQRLEEKSSRILCICTIHLALSPI